MKAGKWVTMALDFQCNIAFRWKPNSNSNPNSNSSINNHKNLLFPKTTLTKPFSKFTIFLTNQNSLISSFHHSPPHVNDNGTSQTAPLVENFNEHQSLRDLLGRLSNTNSCPLQILSDDGDWTKDQFWAVIRFLTHASRPHQILQVFSLSLSLSDTHTLTQKS